jgi:hypothetical protein
MTEPGSRILDARPVPDDKHLLAGYRLTAPTVPIEPTPVIVGWPWHRAFWTPIERREHGRRTWWLPEPKDGLGPADGGHCVALRPAGAKDDGRDWTRFDQGREGSCFPAGTMIRLATGTWKKIEDIRPLDQVLTAEGNVGLVLKIGVRWTDDGLARVRLRGHNGIRCTPEHPVLTDHGYVPAAELTAGTRAGRGDRVCLPHGHPGEPEVRISTGFYVERRARRAAERTRSFGGVATQAIAFAEEVIVTEGLATLIGLYLAEGSTTSSRTQWTFGWSESETLVPLTQQLIRDELGAEAHVQRRPHGSINVVLYGTAWKQLFEGMCGTGSECKRVPEQIAMAAAPIRKAALDGWLMGDGYERRGGQHGTTVSHELALGMWAIANGLGMTPTIRVSQPKAGNGVIRRRPRWDVEIAAAGRARATTTDGAAWRTVTSVDREPWRGFVYNLEVSGDHSYVAEGLGVHNCVGWGTARAMWWMWRRTVDPLDIYRAAQLVDPFPDTPPGEGTDVRSALDVLRSRPPRVKRAGGWADGHDDMRIGAFRWVQSVEDVHACLKDEAGAAGGYVVFCNSWGKAGYPHFTRIPDETLNFLLFQNWGEGAAITER